MMPNDETCCSADSEGGELVIQALIVVEGSRQARRRSKKLRVVSAVRLDVPLPLRMIRAFLLESHARSTPMTIDDILKLLAPLTPAVLPVVTYIWYRTSHELHAIRKELAGVRQAIGGEPRLAPIVAAGDALRADAVRTDALRLIASGYFDDEKIPAIGLTQGETTSPGI
jgi:hypothetical protein